MKVRSMIDEKKKKKVQEAIRKNDPSMLWPKKKAGPELVQTKQPKKRLSPEMLQKLDAELLDRLRFSGNTDLKKQLLENGANPNARNEKGETALMVAVMTFGRKLGATVMIQIGNPDSEKRVGQELVRRHNEGIMDIDILLEAGADVNAQDSQGKTAWDHAFECKENIRRLFEYYGATNLK